MLVYWFNKIWAKSQKCAWGWFSNGHDLLSPRSVFLEKKIMFMIFGRHFNKVSRYLLEEKLNKSNCLCVHTYYYVHTGSQEVSVYIQFSLYPLRLERIRP
uniref:Uncharacterized protein n=1 Tax=Cacopsylla melanoneura TaxID=428564 RepID=A0A8D8LQA8_9HEMI